MNANTLVETASGRTTRCAVSTAEASGSCQVLVVGDALGRVVGRGDDVEDALADLRQQLETRGFLLLCNRFRRDAVVSALSRQMSRGLGCYLVRSRQPVQASQIVDCLGPADAADVVPAEDAERFIAEWRREPPRRAQRLLAFRRR